ncbi:hypothetical protein CR513_32120 [Mucuna pruriens]|uniref:Uncharacterized protein n=1 Tax=Mucuna pruriens TaxID=157652 RepID=A0A371G7K1_MUCPR|nr:hypothetical protein CR513_32120 [Mucuna pruriens]
MEGPYPIPVLCCFLIQLPTSFNINHHTLLKQKKNGREADTFQRLGTGISRMTCQSLATSSVPRSLVCSVTLLLPPKLLITVIITNLVPSVIIINRFP